jgi:hypothetical protein
MRTLAGQSRALGGEVPADTGTGLSVLHEAERENGREDD